MTILFVTGKIRDLFSRGARRARKARSSPVPPRRP
jgi:hypothetical protein